MSLDEPNLGTPRLLGYVVREREMRPPANSSRPWPPRPAEARPLPNPPRHCDHSVLHYDIWSRISNPEILIYRDHRSTLACTLSWHTGSP